MKKLFFFAGLMIFGLLSLSAQKHSLGFRSGSGEISGVELSYQNKLNDLNRFQLDLGVSNRKGVDAFKISGLYQWVKDLPKIGDDFRWHYGIGAGMGFISYDEVSFPNQDYGSNLLSIDAMIGLEYSLFNVAEIPLQIGLDVKPSLQFFNSYFDILGLDLALSLRWQFEL
jgi:hypothetical protein